MNNYITFNHANFTDIGIELHKLSIVLSIAIKYNKTLVLFNSNYMSIIDTFIKYKYKSISTKEFNELNFNYIRYKQPNPSYNGNIYIFFNNNDDLSLEDIDDNIRDLMTLLLQSNNNYNSFVCNKINDIMNYFNTYDINNLLCIYIKNHNYNKEFYLNTYNNHFKSKKIIIFTNNIDDTYNNLSFENSIIIEINDTNKYTNFIIMSIIPNIIISDNNYLSRFAAFIGNKNKKIINYIDENIQNKLEHDHNL
jgi:hypothetical protein